MFILSVYGQISSNVFFNKDTKYLRLKERRKHDL